MKNIKLIAAALAVTLGANAQDTYQSADIATRDLNGTAKFVGMGGAMDALGGDISTISTNPAGVGLFRHSWAGASAGFSLLSGSLKNVDAGQVKASFDQVGFVLANPDEDGTWNIAFNYHKSRNFNQILNAANRLNGESSQNIGTYNKLVADSYGKLFERQINQIDWMLSDGLLYNTTGTGEDDYMYYALGANAFNFDQKHHGYIGNYDINFSGSIENRFFIGLTVGIKDVHYHSYSEYTESMVGESGALGDVTITDDRSITGTGYDVTLGAIYRPIEESPFRIGVTVASPTFYKLTSTNDSYLYNGTESGDFPASLNRDKDGTLRPIYRSREDYTFKLYTPWRFGLSLAHTVGSSLALGASYDYASYGSLDNRYDYGGSYWDDLYGYSDNSESDVDMNNATKKALKGVSTFKLGIEYKPISYIALRAGYNYVSPMYKDNAIKDGYVDSDGQAVSSQTAWTNWGATNRITCGVGIRVDNWNFDIAYQYSMQKGDFHAFESEYYSDYGLKNGFLDNTCPVTKVDNNRSQLLFSLGYTF